MCTKALKKEKRVKSSKKRFVQGFDKNYKIQYSLFKNNQQFRVALSVIFQPWE